MANLLKFDPMLPDITQQYLEKPFRYTRRPVQEEPPLEIIAQCELCWVLMASDQEVVTYKDMTFCGKRHVEEYKQMERDGEI